MRVRHLYATYVSSLTEGISKNIDALCAALRRQGDDAAIDAAPTALEGLNRRAIHLTGGWAAYRRAREALASPDVDLVHYHVSIPATGFFAAMARVASPRGRPLVVHVWNPYFQPADAAARLPRVARWTHRVFNGPAPAAIGVKGVHSVIVSSRYQARQLRRIRFRGHIHVVPNGVDLHRYRPASGTERQQARDRLGVTGDPVLLYYGHLSPWKGADVLLRALPAWLRENPRGQAVIAHTSYGNGGARLRADLARLGVSNRVLLLGTAHVPDLHAASDMVALPATASVGTACHPNVLLESLAAGLPVVATAVGSVPEVVQPWKTGLLVPPGDASRLSGALCALGADPALRRRLGAQARNDAETRFDWDAVGRRMHLEYERILRGEEPLPQLPLSQPRGEGPPLRWPA